MMPRPTPCSWSLGTLATRRIGQVTFQAQIAATATVGSTISNQAEIACTEVTLPVMSNIASFTVVAPRALIGGCSITIRSIPGAVHSAARRRRR